MENFNSRWVCPKCGSGDLYVSLPSWFMEDQNGDLIFIQVDEEAAPAFWVCKTCDSSGPGSPTDWRKTEDE